MAAADGSAVIATKLAEVVGVVRVVVTVVVGAVYG
jgi:hypothetical protein